jgi:hypothetical protein
VGKPIQAAGSSGTSGQVLTSTGSSISWTTPFNGDYNLLSNKPTIPAAQVNADWNSVSGASRILNKPVVPAVPNVTTAAASGSGSLSYNSLNGEFTFTPPNLSSYLTSYTETDPVFAASEASSITSTDTSNWDAAYSWGNHISAGYLTSTGSINTHTDVDTTTIPPSNGQVLKWNGSQWAPANDLTAEGVGIGLTDLSATTASASGNGSLSYDNTSGVFTFTPPNLSTYLTSTGSIDSHTDVTITSATTTQLLRYNGTQWANWTPNFLTTETDPVFSASVAAGITSTNTSNWNTAYGWGNHASAGYLTTESDTLQTITNRGTTTTATITAGGLALGDNKIAAFGDSNDLQIFHNSSVSVIRDAGTGGLLIDSDNEIKLAKNGTGNDTLALFTVDGSAELYYDNAKKFETTSTGATVTGNLNFTGDLLKNGIAYSIVANATISDTAPGGASAGDLWWESDTGRLKIYYNDTDTTQWVDASPPLQQDRIATSSAPATATSTGTAGEIRYDSGYVYICVATNTWKRAALTTW